MIILLLLVLKLVQKVRLKLLLLLFLLNQKQIGIQTLHILEHRKQLLL